MYCACYDVHIINDSVCLRYPQDFFFLSHVPGTSAYFYMKNLLEMCNHVIKQDAIVRAVILFCFYFVLFNFICYYIQFEYDECDEACRLVILGLGGCICCSFSFSIFLFVETDSYQCIGKFCAL